MPSRPPENLDDDDHADYTPLDPTLSLSVLIILPAPMGPSKDEAVVDTSDDWLDLPDMMVGTTRLVPYLNSESNIDEGNSTIVNEHDGEKALTLLKTKELGEKEAEQAMEILYDIKGEDDIFKNIFLK